MNRFVIRTAGVIAAVVAVCAGATPAKAAFTISWNQAGTTVTTDGSTSDFNDGTMTFTGVSLGSLLDITDSGGIAIAHDHGGLPGTNITLELRINGTWTTIHSQLLGAGATQNIHAIATPIDFADGTVDGLRFFSNPNQDYTYHGFDSTLTFHFEEANPVPAPPGAVLFGIGMVCLAGFRHLRRKTEAASATTA